MRGLLIILGLVFSFPAFGQQLVINGQSGTIYTNLNISTTSGPCVIVEGNSTNITIQASNIGPCGDNNTTNASDGIYIAPGASSVNIYDNYIHVENPASVCSPASHDGILVLGNTGQVNIQGNVFAHNQNSVQGYNSSNISVVGNYSIDPLGPGCGGSGGGAHITIFGDPGANNHGIYVANNYTHTTSAGFVEDSIGVGETTGITVIDNYADDLNDDHGCAYTMDANAFGWNVSNNLANSRNCGIQITSGDAGSVANANKATVLTGFANSEGMAVATFGSGQTCANITVTNNLIAGSTLPNGSYYTDTGCSNVALSGNTFDANCTQGVDCLAYKALYPMTTTNPPPLIPPLPKTCVAVSPYSTQNSVAPCGVSPPPLPPTVSLSAMPTKILLGGASTLTWSSTNAASCVGNFGIIGTSGSISVTPVVTTQYTISCTGVGGTANAAATVKLCKRKFRC